MAHRITVEGLQREIAKLRKAQEIFSTYSQQQVDAIFRAAAMEGSRQRVALARMAVEETGMGVLEDKVMKNQYAAEFVYHKYRDYKTCGVVEEDTAYGIRKIAEPIGVIGAVIPVTNPTSTAIFKILLCLKTRNAILISPHPGAKGVPVRPPDCWQRRPMRRGRPTASLPALRSLPRRCPRRLWHLWIPFWQPEARG